jgi:hypothetical protein
MLRDGPSQPRPVLTPLGSAIVRKVRRVRFPEQNQAKWRRAARCGYAFNRALVPFPVKLDYHLNWRAER